MINKIKILKIVFIALFSLKSLVAQTVNFTPAGQGTDYMRYNVSTSTAANSGGLTGGFTMTGTAFNDFNMYILQFSFDGTSWNTDVSAMVATTGGLVAGGNGGRFTSTDGNAQISVSHEVLAAVSTWPGNDGSIRLRINESSTTNYYPTAAGITWPIDLTRPSISTSSIVSNNSTNTGYATTNDVITLSITASENLMNTAPYIFNGNISGLDFITQSGADATQWSFASTVTTHAEATVTYDIAYYDENYNLGVSSIISTTDGTTVIVDRTTPSLDVSIASNNSNSTSLAKEGDQITLTISATETLNEAPTVTIMNEPNPTVTPPASSRDYTATHSPTDANGDEEGTVTFSISNVKDRAGNTIGSAVVSTNDGTSVTFDITAPVVQTITSSSNNTYSTARAKEGDVVTVSFSSQEKIQTPTVLIAGEAAVETNANGDQVTWTATKTMDAEDDDDDVIDILINYTDLAGNAGVAKTQDNLEANSAVDYDNTPPNVPGVTVSSSNTINASYAIENSIVSLDITSNEDLLDDTNGDEIPDGVSDVIIAGRSVNNSGVETLTRNNGQSFSAQVQLTGSETADVVTYSFTMTDLTGNTRDVTANTSSIFIDNDDPVISPVSIVSNNATNTSFAKTDDVITLSFTSDEDLSSAVGHTPTATIGISDVTPNAVTGRTEFAATLATTNSMTEEAVGFVLNVTDVAGNTAVINQVTDGTSVTIDNTSPSVNYLRLSSNGAVNTYAKAGEVVTLSFQADEELSSISNITIFGSAPDANPTNLGNNAYSAQYTLQGTEDNGAVPFTLNFVDQAGNTISSNLTSLVDDSDGGITYDDEAPTLDRVTITSSNSNSATLAKVDDVITFSIRATELIKAPTIVIAGRTGAGAATLSDDTNTDGLQIYTATYTMKQDDPEGVVAFTVDFEDLASNAGTQVFELTAADLDGGVTFDKTPPFFNQTIGGEEGSVTISSNNANGNTNLAKIGDQITLSFVATEVIKVGSNPTVVINNNNAVVGRVGDTDKIFTATYSMSAISDGNAEIDPVTFLISGYEDAAGNAGADVNATTDGSTIKYDPVIPTLSNVAMASSNGVNPAFAKADDIITITFNSNETLKFTDADGDGVVDADATEPSISILGSTAGVTITQPQANSWQATKTVASSDDETEVPFSITYGDPAGNVASSPITAVQTGNAVTIDRTSPTLTKLDVKAINSTDSAYVRNGDVVIITIKTDEAIQAPTVTTSHGAASTVTNVDDGVNRKWEARHTAGPFETSGEMTFSVSVSDLADNGPVTSTSLINDLDGSGVTYDNTTPTIDNITFTSNNPVNNAYAKPGDIVTLTFDASERLRQNTIKIDIDVDGDDNFDESNAAGDTMIVQPTTGFSVDDDSEPWVANFTLPGSMDDANVTTIPYRVNFQDLFTVPGVAVQNSLDGDNITFDSSIPDVTVFTVSSDNLRGEEYLVKEGDDISINITADEVLASAPNNPTVSLDGVSVALTAVAGSDTDWEATYTVPVNPSISEGTIPLILNFKDNANNSGVPRQATTDLRTIKFDKTAPSLTALSISSNNAYNSSMAKVGDVVTITFTGSHSLNASPVVSVLGNAADQVSQGADDTQWTATYTLQEGDNEGAITFTVDYTDLALNPGVQKLQSDITDGTSITFDKSPTVVTGYTVALDPNSDTGSASDDQLTNDGTPTFNVSNLTSGDPEEVATNDWLILFVDGVRFDSVQVSSDNESVTIGDARDLPNSPNAYPITFKTRDQAGNLSDATAAVNITVDKDIPAAGEVLDLQAAFDTGISDVDDITNATEPVFTLSGLGPIGNHSINLYYQRTNNAVADTFLLTHTLAQQVSDEITIPNGLALSEDIYTFWYEVVDDAGNASLNSGEKVVTVDLTPPSASATPDLLDDGTGDGVLEFDTGTSNTDNITNLATVQLTISGLSTNDNSVIIYDTKNTNDESDDEVMAEETIDATSMNITINNISTTTYGTKITDAAGNSSILSELLSITFDNTPTNVLGYDDPDGIGGTPGNYSDVYIGAEDEYPPVTIDLIGSSDTGADTTDHITKETLPSFKIKNLTVTDSVFLFATVAGNPDNLVAKGVVDNSTEILRVTDGSAPLHLLTELTQNDYIIKLRVKDVAGNVSAFTQFQFNSDGTYTNDQFVLSVDTTPFTIASDPDLVVADDTGISDSDNITSVRNPEFQFLSLDASADSIELYVTNSSGATALTNSGFKTEGNFDHLLRVSSNLVAGDYNFKYRVIDIAGNESSYSNELAVTIDYTAPADPSNLDLIDADDNGPSNSDDLTNAASMTLTGDGFVSGEYGFLYSYDGPGDADPSDDVLVQSVLLGDSDAGTASFTVANGATGAFYYYVIAQDLAGNASAIASAPSLLINVDLDPPNVDNIVISLDPASDTGILGDNAGFNITPTFTVEESASGLTATDSVVLYYALGPSGQNPLIGLNGDPKRYSALSIDAISENLVGSGFDENGDGTLDEGVYYITARLRDFAGNLSDASAALIYRLDTTPPLYYDVGAQQSDPSQSFVATNLIATDDLGYSSTDNITKKQNPSFTMSNLHPFKNDKVVLSARKAFTTTKVDSGFVAELETDITLTVPWVDANGDGVVDADEGFALDDGTWTMTYTIEDSAGNITSDIPALTVEVDATAPSALGRPDLLTAFDTGESITDNLTNLNSISIDQTDTIPGLQWSLYRFEDNGDGVYNSNDDTIFPLDSNLFPGGQGDDGLDLDNDGVPDGAGSVTSDILVDQDPTYYFFSVQTDIAGNRSSQSEVLTVGVDFVAPNCVITYDDPDGDGNPDNLVRSADGTLNATFTFDDSIDDLGNPPSIIIDYPDPLGASDTLLLTKVSNDDDSVWEYNIPLNDIGMDSLNGFLDIALTAADKYGNAVAGITGSSDIRMDNLPAVFSNIVPGSGSFSNADSIIAFSWNLDEPNEGTNIVSGEIEFFNFNSNQTFNAQLTNPTDLVEGDRAAGIIDNWGANSIPLSEGVYQVIFKSLDFAGNEGADTLTSFTYDLTNPNAEISFSRLYAEDGDEVVVTVVFDEDIYHNEDNLPIFSADLPQGFAVPLTGPLTLVNPPETYDDVGLDSLVGSNDQGELNGQYDLGEPFNDINGNGVYDITGDLFTWSYTFTTGDTGPDLNGGISNITIGNARDLAGNPIANIDLDADNDGIDDTLTIDNIPETATFTYENLTNPSLTDGDPVNEGFTGIGGDTIQVTVTTNQQISATSPVPTLDFEYNTSNDEVQGELVAGVNLATPSVDGLIWVFQVILSDSVYNDGIMNFSFNGKDLADNVVEVENFIDNAIFAVDNLPPTYYETGEVTIVGANPVQGWITGNTTEIVTSVYIEDIEVDSTLVAGQVEIQFYNQTRGQGWITVGQNDDIVVNGDSIDFSRTDDELYAVMDPNSFGPDGLQPGDLLEVRAKVIDKHANVTSFGISPTVLKYDPSGPAIGQITSGVFGITTDASTDTVFSSDQVDITWTPFEELNPNESGLKEYALSILKRHPSTGPNPVSFMDTIITATIDPFLPDTFYSKTLFLEHGTRYVAHIVGIDTAGNFSDTLSSDTLHRLNSPPVFATISGANLNEDTPWTESVQISDLDLDVMQGDSHVFDIETSIDLSNYVQEGTVRGGTYREVYLSYDASRQDDFYTGSEIEIGTAGDPQIRTILSYDGETRTATVSNGENDLSPTPSSGNSYSIIPSIPKMDSLSGVITWTPRQTNAGPVDITVTVTDAYGLADTLNFILVVQDVNDPPESILGDSLSFVSWEEDAFLTLNIGKYFFDVDNSLLQSDNFEWSVVILDTNELDEDFPAGYVIPGPGASNEFVAKLKRDYMGFDPNMNFTSQGLTANRIARINDLTEDHPISVQIFEAPDDDGDGDNDSTMVTFSSDTNYYGADHSIIFYGRDYLDSTVTDSILASITPKNDPPKIDSLPDYVMNENDTLWIKFGPYTNDVDDSSLTFKITALTYDDKMTIKPMGMNEDSLFISSSYEDSIQFIPSPLWSKDHIIQVVVFDDEASDTSSFVLDIERVLRPHFSVSVTQNNAFNKYFQIIVMDTVEKATFVSLDVANSPINNIDTIADFTYTAHVYMESSGNYPIDVSANAVVGDTTIREYFSLAAGRTASRWAGQSFDGKFSVVGNPGAVTYDQSLLIVDSTLFDNSFHDRASYVLGNEDFEFNQPIEVRMAHERDDVAIYRRKNGAIWEELPSIGKDGEIFTLSEKAGYFKLGPKTIIVPEQTSIHQNYPNPFNPTTTIMYDIGLLDGLKQRVSISVYNLLGQHVTTLVENKDQIGQFKIQWNGTDKFGQQMSSGVYFIQLSTKTGIVRNKKMMLLK